MSQIDQLIYFPLLVWFILFIFLIYFLIFVLIVPLLYSVLIIRSNYFFYIANNSKYIRNIFTIWNYLLNKRI